MSDRPSLPERPDEIRLPDQFTQDLVRLYASRPAVLPAIDTAILAAARLRLERRARPSRTARILRWAVPGAAAAAALLILLARPQFSLPPSSRSVVSRQPSTVNRFSPIKPQPSTIDIDRSGRIDILDAFALARRIELGDATDPAWDRTGDGAVDRKDIDAIAFAAVKVAE